MQESDVDDHTIERIQRDGKINFFFSSRKKCIFVSGLETDPRNFFLFAKIDQREIIKISHLKLRDYLRLKKIITFLLNFAKKICMKM